MKPWIPRQILQLNNSCDLMAAEEGKQLFITSRGTNQMFNRRELLLGVVTHSCFPLVKHNAFDYHSQESTLILLRFSYGGGEWRDGAVACLDIIHFSEQ